jgi:hypothetical protein
MTPETQNPCLTKTDRQTDILGLSWGGGGFQCRGSYIRLNYSEAQ